MLILIIHCINQVSIGINIGYIINLLSPRLVITYHPSINIGYCYILPSCAGSGTNMYYSWYHWMQEGY